MKIWMLCVGVLLGSPSYNCHAMWRALSPRELVAAAAIQKRNFLTNGVYGAASSPVEALKRERERLKVSLRKKRAK